MGVTSEDVKSIFAEAREKRSLGERKAFLDKVCQCDPRLRAEVESLLEAADQAGAGFVQDVVRCAAATIEVHMQERPGTVIGPYTLRELVGEGGMGLVFVAEQTDPVRRKVALKVIKPGMDTRQVVARFEAERQALAMMDHPNIAKVLDGGATAGGRPFFVMELVKGVPITEYCDENQVPVRQRLELFLHVCQAVQHAHQKGIIHRDLKPSNVLIMSQDGTPMAKVIDFGVAKAIGQQLTDKTIYTQLTQMVGTPMYMSPEQAGQSGVDVDTRSDIYALGVLLYELLTGMTPFANETLKKVGLDEMRRIIREEDPPTPSTRLAQSTETLPAIADQRKTEPAKLARLIRGDLDWIVMKALEKDRNRRYETASAFAADVQRYLADEPVQACPPSAMYRFRKLVRRKKIAFALTACVFLALAGLTGGIGWAVRDREAREREIAHDREVREAALDSEVERLLGEAGSVMEQEKWPEALAVVERADKLLAAAGRTDRPPRHLELRQELSMAIRLEEIYRQPKRDSKAQAPISREGGAWYASQEQQTSAEQDFFSGRHADAEFAQAFRDFGIDIDALAPADVAAQISRHGVRLALVKALDEWAPLRRRARGEDDPGWKKLIEVASLVDPDPWRNRCREALPRRDRQALEQLADEVPIRQVRPATLCLLGITLSKVGALDKGIDLLRRAQHEYPSDLWINDELGNLCWYISRPPRTEDALRFYSICVALRPMRPNPHAAMASILNAKGAFEEALVESTRAVQLEPKRAFFWTVRGRAYLNVGQNDKALADFSKAIELAPGFGWNELAWLLATAADTKFRDGPRAVDAAEKAVKLRPDSGNVWNTLGAAYCCNRDWKKAKWALEKAMKLRKGGDSSDWFFLAMAHWRLGEREQARAVFDRAVAWMEKHEPKNEQLLRFRAEAERELELKK
jgi:serine/threonine protein kinase/tetratricopeptide (TPR) repeat protein